jgi:hypothetical protein
LWLFLLRALHAIAPAPGQGLFGQVARVGEAGLGCLSERALCTKWAKINHFISISNHCLNKTFYFIILSSLSKSSKLASC